MILWLSTALARRLARAQTAHLHKDNRFCAAEDSFFQHCRALTMSML